MRNARRNAYIQLHVVGAAPWDLSCRRFTRVRFRRAGDELRTDRRWSSRVANTDENGLSRERRSRNLTRDGRDRRRGFAERNVVRARREKLRDQKWDWPVGR